MKYETKVSIIRWVERLLKWNAHDGIPFIIEQRKIQKIRTVHIISKYEANIPKKEMELLVAQSILTTMIHIGAIKFDWTTIRNNSTQNGLQQIEAITYVPEKL